MNWKHHHVKLWHRIEEYGALIVEGLDPHIFGMFTNLNCFLKFDLISFFGIDSFFSCVGFFG